MMIWIIASSFLTLLPSFTLNGISRRFEAWFLGGLVVPWAESFPWPQDFFPACDCVKCLVLKGLIACQHYSMKKVLSYWKIMLAIFSRCAIVSPVASATLNTNTTIQDEKTRHTEAMAGTPRELADHAALPRHPVHGDRFEVRGMRNSNRWQPGVRRRCAFKIERFD